MFSARTRMLVSALPDFGMALYMLLVWIAPLRFGEAAIIAASLIFVTEFFVTHGSAFLGHFYFNETGKERLFHILVFGLVYTCFMALVSSGYGSWWPLAGFWLLLLNRLLPLIFSGAGKAVNVNELTLMCARNILVYLSVVMLGLLPWPKLGVARAVMMPDGQFADDAHKLLAMCFFYFLTQALITSWPLWRRRAAG